MPCSNKYRVQARLITTSRAERATSSTTLAARPAGSQGASSPPLTSIHQSKKNRPTAVITAATIYPRLDGILVRLSRLRASSDVCRSERASLGKNWSVELCPNTLLRNSLSQSATALSSKNPPAIASVLASQIPQGHNSQLLGFSCQHKTFRVNGSLRLRRNKQDG